MWRAKRKQSLKIGMPASCWKSSKIKIKKIPPLISLEVHVLLEGLYAQELPVGAEQRQRPWGV